MALVADHLAAVDRVGWGPGLEEVFWVEVKGGGPEGFWDDL